MNSKRILLPLVVVILCHGAPASAEPSLQVVTTLPDYRFFAEMGSE